MKGKRRCKINLHEPIHHIFGLNIIVIIFTQTLEYVENQMQVVINLSNVYCVIGIIVVVVIVVRIRRGGVIVIVVIVIVILIAGSFGLFCKKIVQF